jgi:hypothetical protein
VATDVLPTDATAGWSPAIESLINHVIWFVPWQTVHFFGFSLIFGTALAVSLRVLGFWKSMPFSAVHRLIPLGVFGVVMNVFSGMRAHRKSPTEPVAPSRRATSSASSRSCGSHAIHATGSISRPIRRRSARRHMFQRFWIIRFLMEFRDKTARIA